MWFDQSSDVFPSRRSYFSPSLTTLYHELNNSYFQHYHRSSYCHHQSFSCHCCIKLLSTKYSFQSTDWLFGPSDVLVA